MEKRNHYTEFEKNYVINHFGFMTSKQIAKALGRSKQSIDTFKQVNNITKYNVRELKREQNVLKEMSALINLAELTDNAIIRTRCKVKLKELSEIPKENFYSLDNTLRRTK